VERARTVKADDRFRIRFRVRIRSRGRGRSRSRIRGRGRNCDRNRSCQDPWKTAPHRGVGHDFVPERPLGGAYRSAQGPCRAPPGGATRSAVPAKRQAAGVPSAWSQPSPNQPTSDHADGTTLGRWDALASRRPRRPRSTESAAGKITPNVLDILVLCMYCTSVINTKRSTC